MRIAAILSLLVLAGCSGTYSDYCLLYEPLSGYGEIKQSNPELYIKIRQNEDLFDELCD